ncbi:MAG: leucine-rich repeat domain-containing protein [Planctomycetes bacterium]|nr:leucine-rich repeat domain-containing protein [Planctomycetota bacterium]
MARPVACLRRQRVRAATSGAAAHPRVVAESGGGGEGEDVVAASCQLARLVPRNCVTRFSGPSASETIMFFHHKGLSVADHSSGLRELCRQADLLVASTKGIELSNVRISELPDQLFAAVNLTSLMITETLIKTLPPAIGRLSRLRELTLTNNKLESLPQEIAQLPRLVVLELAENKFKALPPPVLLMRSLRRLDISNNRLKSLPDDLCRLRRLAELIVIDNQLTSLPACIARMPFLTVLDVSGNRLVDIPRRNPSFSGMEQMYLDGNKLSPECLRWRRDKAYYK